MKSSQHQLKRSMAKALEVTQDHTLPLMLKVLQQTDPQLCGHLLERNFVALIRASPPSVFDPDFRVKYLAYNLARKYPFKVDIDREKAAIDSFLAADRVCAISNGVLLEQYLSLVSPVPTCDDVAVPAFITKARYFIRRVLGEFEWDAAAQFCGFGPGGSTHLKRKHGDVYYKLGTTLGVTPKAHPRLRAVLRRHFPMWINYIDDGHAVIDEVLGSRVTTVPKDAKTDRPIAVEPSGNMFLQKGIGGLIRKRLRTVGLNLNRQQEVNQQLAMLGSLDDSLATIDLASASDCVSLGLTRLLLPDDWYSAIAETRSPLGLMPDGSYILFEKVSSMGNGYTFELETIIFLALAYAVTPNAQVNVNIAAYGDDLIVPRAAAPSLILALEWAGFQVNTRKSFIEGPFRESCGKHYLSGVDVTPVYVKEPINTPERVFWFCNSLRRWATKSEEHAPTVYPAWADGVSRLPKVLRSIRIPDGVGDNGLVSNWDEAAPWFDRDLQKSAFKTFSRITETVAEYEGHAGVLTCLWKLDAMGSQLHAARTGDGKLVVGVRSYSTGIKAFTGEYRVHTGHVYEWTRVCAW